MISRLEQSGTKAAVGIHWHFSSMNSTGMFQWLLSCSLSCLLRQVPWRLVLSTSRCLWAEDSDWNCNELYAQTMDAGKTDLKKTSSLSFLLVFVIKTIATSWFLSESVVGDSFSYSFTSCLLQVNARCTCPSFCFLMNLSLTVSVPGELLTLSG